MHGERKFVIHLTPLTPQSVLTSCFQEAEKASYQAMQMTIEAQAAYVPVASVPAPDIGFADVTMNIDAPRGQKRGAEESPAPEGHKKARTGKHRILYRTRPMS
jgi:hypothetical protein